MMSTLEHELIGEYYYSDYKEVRRALKAAEVFGFDYVLTRRTTAKVISRDEETGTTESDVETEYALQLFHTALGGDDSYDPPIPAYVAVLKREDEMADGEG